METSKNKPISQEKYLDKNETNRLIITCRDRASQDLLWGRQVGVRQWVIIDCFLNTGLRVQELCNLDISDFKPSKRFLKVKTLKQKKERIDEIPLPKELVKHIQEYLKWRTQVGEEITDAKPLFTSTKQERYTRSAVQKLFKKVCRDARLDSVYSIHTLRHTYAVNLLEKTRNIREVQINLRHSDIRMTAAFYADIPFEKRLENVDNLYEQE